MPNALRLLVLEPDPGSASRLAALARAAGASDVVVPRDAGELDTACGGAFDAILVAGTQDQPLPGRIPALRGCWPGAAVVALVSLDALDASETVPLGVDGHLLRDATDALQARMTLMVAVQRARTRTIAEQEQGRIRRLLNDIHIGVFRSTLSGRVLEANAAALRVLGYDSLEAIQAVAVGERYQDPADRTRLVGALRMSGSVRDFETVLLRADGTPVRVTMSIRLDGPDIMDGIVEDITERAGARESLERSEAEWRALVMALPDLVMVLDKDGRYLQVAPNNPHLLARPAEEMLGRTVHDILPREQADAAVSKIREALRLGGVVTHDYHLELQGVTRWFHAAFTPVSPDRIILVARDTTVEREAQREREAREQRFRALIENSRDAITLLDAQARIVFHSASATRITGYAPEEVLGENAFSFNHPEDNPRAVQVLQDAMAAPGNVVQVTHRIRHKSGEWRYYEIDAANWLDHPAIRATVLNYRDVTERLASSRAASESAERLDLALEAAGGVVWDWDLLTGEVAFGPQWAQLLGFEPGEIGNDLGEWERRLHPDDRPAVAQARDAHLAGRQPVYEVEHRLSGKDGTWRWVLDRGRVVDCDADGRPIRMVGILTDVSGRKRLEEQLLQAQKMEAVGQLAGGIAHDFNNVLTAILSTAELVLIELPPDHPHREDLEEIKRSANRAAALTRQLLAYSRRQVLQPRVMDLNGVVTSLDRMLRRILGEQVTLTQALAQGLWHVRADRGQLEQILVNLAVNASDAMPGGGRLTITTENVDRVAEEAGAALRGPCVMLSVADTGVGMDESTRQRVFEPFFTTKSRGKGTGLGLATAYGIVRQSGGVIRVSSAPGAGTTFRIYLPRVDAPVEGDEPGAGVAGGPRPGASGTVLLVEDEEAVRKLGVRILQEAGFSVLPASHAAEALQVAGAHSEPIHLLVTDVVMPGRSGVELAAELSKQRPGLRVLFTSGYPETERGRWEPTEGWGAFLQKPFTPTDLLDAVRTTTSTGAPA